MIHPLWTLMALMTLSGLIPQIAHAQPAPRSDGPSVDLSFKPVVGQTARFEFRLETRGQMGDGPPIHSVRTLISSQKVLSSRDGITHLVITLESVRFDTRAGEKHLVLEGSHQAPWPGKEVLGGMTALQALEFARLGQPVHLKVDARDQVIEVRLTDEASLRRRFAEGLARRDAVKKTPPEDESELFKLDEEIAKLKAPRTWQRSRPIRPEGPIAPEQSWTFERRTPTFFNAELEQKVTCRLSRAHLPTRRLICTTSSRFIGSLTMTLLFDQKRFEVTGHSVLDPATGALERFEETTDVAGAFSVPRTSDDPPGPMFQQRGFKMVMHSVVKRL